MEAGMEDGGKEEWKWGIQRGNKGDEGKWKREDVYDIG